jgi:hypothetical protein
VDKAQLQSSAKGVLLLKLVRSICISLVWLDLLERCGSAPEGFGGCVLKNPSV